MLLNPSINNINLVDDHLMQIQFFSQCLHLSPWILYLWSFLTCFNSKKLFNCSQHDSWANENRGWITMTFFLNFWICFVITNSSPCSYQKRLAFFLDGLNKNFNLHSWKRCSIPLGSLVSKCIADTEVAHIK